MVTGQENYRRAIEFCSPAYIPNTLSVNLDWLWENDLAKIERLRELQSQFPDDYSPYDTNFWRLLQWNGAGYDEYPAINNLGLCSTANARMAS